MEDTAGKLPGSIRPSLHPLHAAFAGAISGGLLLAVAVFIGWERETLLPDEEWYEALPFGPAMIAGVVSLVVGALFGFALWVALTRRPVHPLYMALAWGILLPIVATPTHFWLGDLDAPREGSGLGGAFHAIGVFNLYLYAVLPGSAIAGVTLGAIVGVIKRKRGQSHAVESQQSRLPTGR